VPEVYVKPSGSRSVQVQVDMKPIAAALDRMTAAQVEQSKLLAALVKAISRPFEF
jgi:hypothetical protein